MFAIVVDRHSPFAIVILAHQRVVDVDPRTPFLLGHQPRIHIQNRVLALVLLADFVIVWDQSEQSRFIATCIVLVHRRLIEGDLRGDAIEVGLQLCACFAGLGTDLAFELRLLRV